MSAPSERHDSHFVFRLPRHALRLAAIAFGAGLLLFVLVWWLGRDKGFYKPEPVVAGPTATVVEALPEPLPSSSDGASGLEEKPAPKSEGERPQLVEEKPMSLPQSQATAAETSAVPPPSAALAPGTTAVPIPDQNPPPRYPATAMRRGVTGTVLVRVEVGVDGTPTDVQVAKRSGSRDLDRAAIDAVRDWRFRPGQRDGQPVTSVVTIPIDFSLER